VGATFTTPFMKNSVASFLLVALLAAAFVATPLSLADTPGQSFDPSEDECGFLMGTSVEREGAAYSGGTVDFDSIANDKQACVNELGYFHKSVDHEESWGKHSQWGKIDFAWSTNPNNNVRFGDVSEDGQYRYLKGRAELIELEASDLGGSPVLDNKLQFDWSCEGKPWCNDAALEQRVKVDLSTGALSGVAWNVHTGYMDFTGTTLELAPREIQAFVDVFANDGSTIPGGVDLTTAPVADGYAFYRARVQFFDTSLGRYLTEDEVSANVSVVTTPNSRVYVDQVANKGDALLNSSKNAFYSNCAATPDAGACVLTETDASTSWNSFVFSIAPTSNMLGIADTTAKVVKYPVDRDGGEAWYPESPWRRGAAWMGDAGDAREACATQEGGTCADQREDFFYKRSLDRNRIEIAAVNVTDLEFSPNYLPAGEDYLLNWGEERALNEDAFSYEPPENQKHLSFRPQFRLTTLSVSDGYGLSLPTGRSIRISHNGSVLGFSPQKLQAAPSEAVPRTYRLYSHAYSKLNPAGQGTYSDEYLLFTNANQQDNLDWAERRWGVDASSCPDDNPFPEISGPSSPSYSPEDYGRADEFDEFDGALQCESVDVGQGQCEPGYVKQGVYCVEEQDEIGAYAPSVLPVASFLAMDLPGLPGGGPLDPCGPLDVDCGPPDLGGQEFPIILLPQHCAEDWSICARNSDAYADAYCLDSSAEYQDWYDYWYCEESFSSKDVLPVRMEERVTAGEQGVFAGTFDMVYTQAVTTDTAIAKRATQPSVEFYVCDELSASVKTRFGTTLGNACYYTGYLSVAEPYATKEGLKIKGAVSAVMNGADILDNNENLSQLGVPTTDLRNRLYAQLRRYVVGESGTDFQFTEDVLRKGTLDENMEPKESARNGGIAPLLGGRLLYAQGANDVFGDVTIEGSDSFLDTTLVVFGGNVYIDGDITGGRLQIFVFGGNVYIHPDVKNLYANVFTDQAILSDHAKTGLYDAEGIPERTLAEREKDLKNQLYVNGTLVSLGNALDDSRGVERNLNALREFRYCNEIDPITGTIIDVTAGGTPYPCDLAQLSEYREDEEPIPNAVIVEHHAPSNRQLSLDIL
jgi:hypothetical protein